MLINQVTLPCQNYEQAVAFYNKLGFVLIVDSPDRYARFESPSGDGATLSLHTVEGPHDLSASVVYLDHASAEALDNHVAELHSSGIEFESGPTDESWGWREARLHDPSGNQLCLMYAGATRRFPPWRVDGRSS